MLLWISRGSMLIGLLLLAMRMVACCQARNSDRPKAAWLVFPQPGKHMGFDGALLHGVPYMWRQKSPTSGSKPEMAAPRITFLMNVWPVDEPPRGIERYQQPSTAAGGATVEVGFGPPPPARKDAVDPRLGQPWRIVASETGVALAWIVSCRTFDLVHVLARTILGNRTCRHIHIVVVHAVDLRARPVGGVGGGAWGQGRLWTWTTLKVPSCISNSRVRM